MKRSIIEVGAKFGMVTVLFEVPVADRKTEGGKRREFAMACDCGTLLFAPIKQYLTGRSVSCGCHGRRARLASSTTHGMSNSKPYTSWRHMKERCDTRTSTYYADYGGRGITYTPSWVSFDAFWDDMGSSYSEGLELDRVDVNGNYGPTNCRWATESLQAYNKRKHVTNTSGRTGVYKSAAPGSWWAEIQDSGATKWLGTFRSFDAACAARRTAELQIYGQTKS